MEYQFDDPELIANIARQAEYLLLKNSNYVFVEELDHPNTKKILKNLNNLPNEEMIDSFKELLIKIQQQYHLNILETSTIECLLLSMGELYAKEIWANAGFSPFESDFSKDIERAINIARYFEYTSFSQIDPYASPSLEYFRRLKEKLKSDGQTFKKLYRKKWKRAGGDQEKTSKESTQLSLAKIVFILDQKKIPGISLKLICSDLKSLYDELYSKIKNKTYSHMTLANNYRIHKKKFSMIHHPKPLGLKTK